MGQQVSSLRMPMSHLSQNQPRQHLACLPVMGEMETQQVETWLQGVCGWLTGYREDLTIVHFLQVFRLRLRWILSLWNWISCKTLSKAESTNATMSSTDLSHFQNSSSQKAFPWMISLEEGKLLCSINFDYLSTQSVGVELRAEGVRKLCRV